MGKGRADRGGQARHVIVAAPFAVARRFLFMCRDAAGIVMMMVRVDRDRAAHMGSIVRVPRCGRRRQPQGDEGEAEQAEEAAEWRRHAR